VGDSESLCDGHVWSVQKYISFCNVLKFVPFFIYFYFIIIIIIIIYFILFLFLLRALGVIE